MGERSPTSEPGPAPGGGLFHNLKGDVSGGFSAAVIALPVAISCGNQKWKIVPRGGGWNSLVVQHSNKCLDLAGGRKNNGAQFHQWDCNARNTNQLFQVIEVLDKKIDKDRKRLIKAQQDKMKVINKKIMKRLKKFGVK